MLPLIATGVIYKIIGSTWTTRQSKNICMLPNIKWEKKKTNLCFTGLSIHLNKFYENTIFCHSRTDYCVIWEQTEFFSGNFFLHKSCTNLSYPWDSYCVSCLPFTLWAFLRLELHIMFCFFKQMFTLSFYTLWRMKELSQMGISLKCTNIDRMKKVFSNFLWNMFSSKWLWVLLFAKWK